MELLSAWHRSEHVKHLGRDSGRELCQRSIRALVSAIFSGICTVDLSLSGWPMQDWGFGWLVRRWDSGGVKNANATKFFEFNSRRCAELVASEALLALELEPLYFSTLSPFSFFLKSQKTTPPTPPSRWRECLKHSI